MYSIDGAGDRVGDRPGVGELVEESRQGMEVLFGRLAGLGEAELFDALGALERYSAWLESVKNAAICQLADRDAGAEATEPAALRAGRAGHDKQWNRDEHALMCRLSAGEARRRWHTALALRTVLPATALALEQGRISGRHAESLARATAPLGADAGACARVERQVLAHRRKISAWQFFTHAEKLVAGLMPEVAERDAECARASRTWSVWDIGDGLGRVSALLPTEDLTRVVAAIAREARPLDPADERSWEQRQADALVDLVTRPAAAGAHPQADIVVHLVAGQPPTWATGPWMAPRSAESAATPSCAGCSPTRPPARSPTSAAATCTLTTSAPGNTADPPTNTTSPCSAPATTTCSTNPLSPAPHPQRNPALAHPQRTPTPPAGRTRPPTALTRDYLQVRSDRRIRFLRASRT